MQPQKHILGNVRRCSAAQPPEDLPGQESHFILPGQESCATLFYYARPVAAKKEHAHAVSNLGSD